MIRNSTRGIDSSQTHRQYHGEGNICRKHCMHFPGGLGKVYKRSKCIVSDENVNVLLLSHCNSGRFTLADAALQLLLYVSTLWAKDFQLPFQPQSSQCHLKRSSQVTSDEDLTNFCFKSVETFALQCKFLVFLREISTQHPVSILFFHQE